MLRNKGGGWYQICYNALQWVGGWYVITEWPLTIITNLKNLYIYIYIYIYSLTFADNELFHFLSVQGYGCKNPRGLLIMIFSRGLSQSLYIFPAGKFAPLPFSEWETEIFFTGIIFSEGSNRLRFNSRGFNNHSFQGILIFKNLVIHTPVWVKNGTAQFLVQSCSERLLVLY